MHIKDIYQLSKAGNGYWYTRFILEKSIELTVGLNPFQILVVAYITDLSPYSVIFSRGTKFLSDKPNAALICHTKNATCIMCRGNFSPFSILPATSHFFDQATHSQLATILKIPSTLEANLFFAVSY